MTEETGQQEQSVDEVLAQAAQATQAAEEAKPKKERKPKANGTNGAAEPKAAKPKKERQPKAPKAPKDPNAPVRQRLSLLGSQKLYVTERGKAATYREGTKRRDNFAVITDGMTVDQYYALTGGKAVTGTFLQWYVAVDQSVGVLDDEGKPVDLGLPAPAPKPEPQEASPQDENTGGDNPPEVPPTE